MLKIPFVKMVGAGNDFIVIEPNAKLDYIAFTKAVCSRHMGIGADGVLILEKSETSDYRMRIINADGSEAEMCGNGARCMAAYIVNKHAPTKKIFGVETLAGEILAEAKSEEACVRLSNPKDYEPNIEIKVDGRKMMVHYIDTGVPHVIVFVEGLQEIDVSTLGRVIRNHQRFAPRGANVNFVEPASKAGGKGQNGMVAVRTYERGIEAETLACGTGSVAAALVSFMQLNPGVKDKNSAAIKVLTSSKEVLEVAFDLHKDGHIDNVWLYGTAKTIASGEYYYDQ